MGGRLGRVASTFTTASGREVRLAIYVEPGKEDRAGYALDALERSMRWDERVFGLEYDLDEFNIVAVSDFNMGAMENKGLNIFNDKYVLASPETATDSGLRQYRGDHRARIFPQLDRQPHHLPRLVPALPEGRPDGLSRPGILLRRALPRRPSHRRGRDSAGAAIRRRMRAPSPIRCARRRYREINNFYTATVYEKGAEIVRMLKTMLGDEDFRRGMDST